MRKQTIEVGGARATRPPGPLARLFGRSHSVPTETMLQGHSAPEHPSAMQADFGMVPGSGVELRAASIRGLSHRGDPDHLRQDSYAWYATASRMYIAVADGVGSAPHSHIGARTAVRTAIELMSSGVGDPRIIGRVVAARIAAVARTLGAEPGALATTLTAALVHIGDMDASWRVLVAEWGDSHASVFTPGVAVDGHPAWRRITPAIDTVLVNEVPALPFHSAATALGSAMLSPGEVLMVATDGIDAHLRAENSVGHGLARSWTTPPSIAQFVSDVDFERVGARDDRTAVAVFRPGIDVTSDDNAGGGR